MPQDIPFTWSEDENMLYFVLQARGAKQAGVDVALCDVYAKVNCRPNIFAVDLKYEVEPEHKQTMCKIGNNKISLTLRKRVPGLWHDFRAAGTKAQLTERRNIALAAAAERETERLKKREDKKHEMVKCAEHEQWRLDRENREKIEKWEEAEKAKWEEQLLSGFDEEGRLQDGAGDGPEAHDDDDIDRPDIEESMSAPRPGMAAKHASKQTNVVNPEVDFETDEIDLPQVCEVTDEEAADIRSNKSKAAGQAQPAVDKDAIWTSKDLNEKDEYEE